MRNIIFLFLIYNNVDLLNQICELIVFLIKIAINLIRMRIL